MHYIYHLVDPETRTVRYVGMSKRPKARLRAHIAEARARQNTKKKQWIADLLAAGLEPVLVIAAEREDESAARERESAEVHRHKATAYNLHDPKKGARDLAKQTRAR